MTTFYVYSDDDDIGSEFEADSAREAAELFTEDYEVDDGETLLVYEKIAKFTVNASFSVEEVEDA